MSLWCSLDSRDLGVLGWGVDDPGRSLRGREFADPAGANGRVGILGHVDERGRWGRVFRPTGPDRRFGGERGWAVAGVRYLVGDRGWSDEQSADGQLGREGSRKCSGEHQGASR